MSADKLQNLIKEYEDRSLQIDQHSAAVDNKTPIKHKLGDLWFNPETNILYICNGRINGKFHWQELKDWDKL